MLTWTAIRCLCSPAARIAIFRSAKAAWHIRSPRASDTSNMPISFALNDTPSPRNRVGSFLTVKKAHEKLFLCKKKKETLQLRNKKRYYFNTQMLINKKVPLNERSTRKESKIIVYSSVRKYFTNYICKNRNIWLSSNTQYFRQVYIQCKKKMKFNIKKKEKST